MNDNICVSQLSVGAELSLEVAYYNEVFAVWEPMIEPVEEEGKGYRPWEIKVKVSSHVTGHGRSRSRPVHMLQAMGDQGQGQFTCYRPWEIKVKASSKVKKYLEHGLI